MSSDAFASHTENTRLRALIDSAIRARGPVTFRDFMDVVLYHPNHGYYSAREEVIGPRGDYLTSPELSPLFGAMIGRQAAEVWRLLERPPAFTLVEAGPGNGTMMAGLLDWAARAEPEFREALACVLVERSPAHRSRSRHVLESEERVSWSEELPAAVTGMIVSNELLDALPVHLVQVEDAGLAEIYVGHSDGRLVEVSGNVSTPRIARYFARLGMAPGPMCRAEVNLDAPDWITSAAAALARGMLLTLDYGYPAATLYAPWRRQGTLMCFHKHIADTDPLIRVGRQDITSHVDFTTVGRAGVDAGLTLAGFASQYQYLSNLGISDALGSAGGEEYVARYRAIHDLLQPEGLGRVRVLALTRGLDHVPLTGFAGTADPGVALGIHQ